MSSLSLTLSAVLLLSLFLSLLKIFSIVIVVPHCRFVVIVVFANAIFVIFAVIFNVFVFVGNVNVTVIIVTVNFVSLFQSFLLHLALLPIDSRVIDLKV